jgi:uncharacterized protein (DUF2267 family)
MKLSKEVKAILDKPAFEGVPMTLRDVLRAFRDAMEGNDADAIQRQTGMPLEDCIRVANAAGAVLSCQEL